VQPNLSSAEQG